MSGANGRRAPSLSSPALGDNEDDELNASGEVSGVAGKEASGARRFGSTRCAGTGSIDWRLRELRVEGAATSIIVTTALRSVGVSGVALRRLETSCESRLA